MSRRSRFVSMSMRIGVTIAVGATMTLAAAARDAAPPSAKTPLVAVEALRALLPDMSGWQKERAGGELIKMSDSCAWIFADALFTKDGMKARVTLADTGSDPDGVAMLAAIVVSFKDGSVNVIERTATVRRFTVSGFPAASRWDTDTKDGEFTVLVAGRFVASAEGTHLDSIDTLRAIVERIDLKKLADLK